MIIHKCFECGKFFTYGTRKDGLPNGIVFVKKDSDEIYPVCTDCMIRKGKEVRERNETKE